MATLILDRADLDIRLDGDALAFYDPAGKRGSAPLKLLDRVVIQGNVRLETSVLTKLAEAGAATLLLSKRHSRRLAIVLGMAHNDAGIRLAQAQRVSNPDWCARWAQRQVRAKTQAQVRLLRHALENRPDARKPLIDALDSLLPILGQLLHDTPDMATTRGLEGAAARSYFQGLAALFPPSLEFSGRNRRPPKDPVNACLSLGYTLLHFDAVRACHTAGLDPLLGFYHRPSFGRESLASDLIEPLRPLMDQHIWQLFRTRTLRDSHFSRDGAACLLGKAGRGLFYQHYENQAEPLRRLLRRQAQILARHLKTEGAPLLEHDEEEV